MISNDEEFVSHSIEFVQKKIKADLSPAEEKGGRMRTTTSFLLSNRHGKSQSGRNESGGKKWRLYYKYELN